MRAPGQGGVVVPAEPAAQPQGSPEATTSIHAGRTAPDVPASLFGVVLGLAGLGNDWRDASRLWGAPHLVGELVLALAAGVWLTLLVLFGVRWLLGGDALRQEFSHPVQTSFFALLPVTTLLMALAVRPYALGLGWTLFALGAVGQLSFGVFRYGQLWVEDRRMEHTTSGLFLPTVAGNFVSTIVAGVFGQRDVAGLFFGAGLFSWLALESVVLGRLITMKLPSALRPSLGVHLAPPAVGAIAYLGLTQGPPDVLAQGLIGYAVFVALVLGRLVPWLRSHPFSPAYWAFSFGATVLALALLRANERGLHGVYGPLAALAFLGANLLVVGLAALTVQHWLSGSRLVR